MKIKYIVYGVFKDHREYREYYDLIIADEGLALIYLGRLPIVPKKHPSLSKHIEKQLLEIAKRKQRPKYSNPQALQELLKRSNGIFLPQEVIVCINIIDTTIPLPPILRKPSPRNREKSRNSIRILRLDIFFEFQNTIQTISLYTTLKLKNKLKIVLKETGYYTALD